MPKDTPYRAPIAPEVSAPIPPLVVVWRDAERSPWKDFLLDRWRSDGLLS